MQVRFDKVWASPEGSAKPGDIVDLPPDLAARLIHAEACKPTDPPTNVPSTPERARKTSRQESPHSESTEHAQPAASAHAAEKDAPTGISNALNEAQPAGETAKRKLQLKKTS